jgi:cellulose synthase/poly-beta-1,6-N-acetylglucosamine synthase-like glycosyltransferase
MKFEQKYPTASATDKFEFEYSYITKDVRLGQCAVCGSFTRWIDGRMQKSVCSEECCNEFWKSNQDHSEFRHQQLSLIQKSSETEIALASVSDPVWKDIIIVVRDQLPYLKMCIESVREHTKDYTLYIWDNGSGKETKEYLEQIQKEHVMSESKDWDIEVWTSEKNEGFIKPNNRLAHEGQGEYIILLNSDTKVFKHWDTAMVGWLQHNEEVAQVGYWGGHLGPDGRGFGGDNGYEIDYIPGWCFCISRETYNKHGLFDDANLDFAYCEDADFSLRLLESGKKLYALHVPLVFHYQNKTIQAVRKEGEIDVLSTFNHNHEYISRRWKDYLESKRVLLKGK